MNLTSLSSKSALFRDPALSRLRRVGVVDVGSNSVRLVVFDGAARSPAYYFNEKVFCGLGAMLARTGKLNPEGRNRAMAAIKRFALLSESLRLSTLIGVGTAAVREASDGQEFLDQVERTTGLRVSIASAEDEARLAAQGVLVAWPEAEGIVCDLGGYSAEFAEISAGGVSGCMTTPLGPLALLQFDSDPDMRKRHLAGILEDVGTRIGIRHSALHLVGGSWRALARLSMEHRQYPLKVINEYRITPKSVLDTLGWIRTKGHDDPELRNIVSGERLRHLPLAGEVLEAMLDRLQPSEIFVSANGIREGLLYEYMPEQLRLRDPLIEACIHTEASSARRPGFGDLLFEFVRPLFKDADRRHERLVRAACLLHDVTWRAHPDYRASISFDNATRSNLGGLDHSGRIFLALALYHRYRNSGQDPSIVRFLPLLPQSDAVMAEVLGKAMRFGAMFAVNSPDRIARLKFKSRRNRLILTLPASFKDFYGAVPEARFGSLAKAMDCEPEVEVV